MTTSGTSPDSMDPVDGCLVADQVTFGDVLARYQTEIYHFAAHLTRNRADADELYQQTLREAFRAFNRLDGTANPRAWLYSIAANAFLSDRPTCGREDSLAEKRAAELPVVPREHVARLTACDLLREVEAFIAALPRRQRVRTGAAHIPRLELPGDRHHSALLRGGSSRQRP